MDAVGIASVALPLLLMTRQDERRRRCQPVRLRNLPKDSKNLRIDTTMKSANIILIVVATLLTSCGEGEKERARKEAERDRQFALEYQRQENIQRQAERDQRAIEAVVDGLDVLTR